MERSNVSGKSQRELMADTWQALEALLPFFWLRRPGSYPAVPTCPAEYAAEAEALQAAVNKFMAAFRVAYRPECVPAAPAVRRSALTPRPPAQAGVLLHARAGEPRGGAGP